MKLFIGTDHRGFQLKQQLKDWLEVKGHQITDCGAFLFNPDDDYPDFAICVGEKVATHPDSFGIVICGSSIGAAMAANKVDGVLAAGVCNVDDVIHARESDNVNVLALSADKLSFDQAKKLIETFLKTSFKPEARFARRIKKIKDYEKNHHLSSHTHG